MKILHACIAAPQRGGDFSGTETYCASLAREQALNGHEVRIVTYEGPATARWSQFCGKAQVVTLPKWLPATLDSWAIARIIKGFEADIIHTHGPLSDVRAGRAARSRKVAWVTTVHDRWNNAMLRSQAAICIANWQRSDIMASHYKGFINTVRHWLPFQSTASTQAVENLRTSWHAGQHTIVFGSVGRLHGQKGMDILIKAFQAAYPEPETDVRLIIVGDGDDRQKLEQIKGTDRRIILTGYQSDLSAYYEAFDAYISAARYEPFGLTILEAMSHGRQLVCTRTEGPSEFLHDASGKGQVIWAERGNVESLAAALRMAQTQGREHITYDLKPFALNRAYREINAIYEFVLNNK